MTEKEIKSKITQAHTDGYNRGYAKREEEIKTLGERCNQLLKDKGNLIDQIADIKANCDLAIEGKDVKIMELEKENAELKGLKDVTTLIRANNDIVVTLMQLNNKLVSKSQQLTKAKEIIKGLLSCCRNYPQENAEKIKQAEEFIKE